jgi:hypothetical protein
VSVKVLVVVDPSSSPLQNTMYVHGQQQNIEDSQARHVRRTFATTAKVGVTCSPTTSKGASGSGQRAVCANDELFECTPPADATTENV